MHNIGRFMGSYSISKEFESEITKDPEAGDDKRRDAEDGEDPHTQVVGRLLHGLKFIGIDRKVKSCLSLPKRHGKRRSGIRRSTTAQSCDGLRGKRAAKAQFPLGADVGRSVIGLGSVEVEPPPVFICMLSPIQSCKAACCQVPGGELQPRIR